MPWSEKDDMLRYVTFVRALGVLPLAAALFVSLTPAHAQPVAAKVIEMSGQVSVLKDGYPQALFVSGSIAPKQLVITGPDGYAKFQVSDGSTFEIYPNAKVTFRENYPSWTELLQIWLGRVRVQIDHTRGANPNKVSTPTAVISVRGTVFDVVVEDEDDTTLVSVEEGLVAVTHRTQASRDVLLHGGESVRVYRNQPLARLVDRTPAVRTVLNAARQALYEVMTRRSATTVPGGGTTIPSGGAQGDKCKDCTGTTTAPGAPGAPGAPTTAPSAPGPPPGQ
jgi:hypothetical protein